MIKSRPRIRDTFVFLSAFTAAKCLEYSGDSSPPFLGPTRREICRKKRRCSKDAFTNCKHRSPDDRSVAGGLKSHALYITSVFTCRIVLYLLRNIPPPFVSTWKSGQCCSAAVLSCCRTRFIFSSALSRFVYSGSTTAAQVS